MEAQKRLELYEKALIDYELKAKQGNIFTYYGLSRLYIYGFCYYFSRKHEVGLSVLSELYKPEMGCDQFYYNLYNKHPRIKALKKAIETVKKLIND